MKQVLTGLGSIIIVIRNCVINYNYNVIISPNEVFSDIMVLASPPPRPPVDPDDVNTLTRKIFNGSLSKFI